MEPFKLKIEEILTLLGLSEPTVNVDLEGRHIDIFVNEGNWIKKWLPELIFNLDCVIRLIAKKSGMEYFILDVNGFKKEREKSIIELAKAAARKASSQKSEVRLPAMNAYERRIVHTELAVRPDVKTESSGEGRDRCVVIRPI